MYNNSKKLLSRSNNKQHNKSRALLLSTTAFMVGAFVAPADVRAQSVTDVSWNYDTVLGGNVSKALDDVTHTTDITVDGGNGFVEGNADIQAGHTVNVEGMNGAQTFAYRDNRDNITSTLSGNLNSNIQVVIIDKDGLFFTSLSQIDVQGLIATSADVAVADIMDGGTLVLDNVGDGGAVIIDGSITVAEAGLAAFVSPFISNRGLIKAKLGNVVMAAGETVTLDMYGDGLVEVAVDGELADALIANVGEIKAAGGFVQITAKAAKGTLDNLINNEGLITVSSAEVQGGKIILSGGNSGTVNNDGVLRTSEGGSIDISGERFEQGDAAPLFAVAALVEGDAPIPPRKPAIRGGDVTIETDGSVEIYEGKINARGGDINIDNGGVFYSANANTLKTEGNGTITLNQSMGLVIPALKLSSIQNAVDAVDNSGDGQNTINVSAGIYIESVDVDHDNMTLNGANAGIDGDSVARGAETIILPGSPAFTVTSDNVTIDGFSIIGDGVGNDVGVKVDSADDVSVANNTMIGVDFGVLADNADYLNVSNNNIDLALVDGIHIDSSDHINVSGNVINGSAVDGIKVSGGHGAVIYDNEILASGDEGIDVHDNNGVVISENTVDTTGLDSSDGNGIHLVNSGRARIVENAILKAGDDGIEAEGNNNLRILRNRVKGSGDDGIQVSDSEGALIKKNSVTFSDDDGIYVSDSDNVRIMKNRISNADDAIRGNDLGDAVISRNIIRNVDSDGITVDTFGTLQISYNDISDVDGSGLYIHEGNAVSAYDNWITRTGYDGIHIAEIYGEPSEEKSVKSELYGSDVDIYGNDVSFSGDDGIYVNDVTSTYIADNVVGHVIDDGIDVHNTELSYIVGNVVAMTGDNGIGVDGGAYAGIFDNKILLTGDQGIDIDHVNWGFDGPLVALGNRDYGYGWSVNIAGNEVAFTGTSGIEVQESGATRVSYNDVIFAGMGHELSHLINDVNERALDSVADDAPRRVEISRQIIMEDYEPSFSWTWGDGDGIHVDNTYGYGPEGWSVKIDNNRVARTGGDGIEVHDAGRTLIDANVVRYAGIDETQWYGYRSLGSLLNSGPFASEGRRNLWGDRKMNKIIRRYIPTPSYIGWSDNDGIRAENINNQFYDDGPRILAAPAFAGQIKEGGEGYYGYEYDLVITNNKVRKTGDDGIDVNSAGRTLIGWNNVRNVGGYISEGDMYRYYDDEFEYEFEGADGIHVDNVYGYNGYYDVKRLVGEGEYGYRGYAVDVIGNVINRTNDDGIEIVDSGSAYIADNIIRNAGFGRGEGYGGSDYLGADGIHVRNVYGEGFGPGILGVDYAVVISGNRIRTTGDDGIEVNGAGRTLIDGNRVRNAGLDYYFGGDGITVSGVFAREFYNDDYEGEGDRRELRISPDYTNLGYSVIITDNNVRNTGDNGISVFRSGSTLIDNNYVDDAMRNGIFVAGPRGRIKGPILRQTSEASFGLYNDGFRPIKSRSRVVITNNEVTHSGRDGILAMDIPDLTISSNNVSESGEHGVHVGGAFNGNVEFQDNILIDNGVEEGFAQARFESGDIDMSDLARPNIFINSTGTAATALQFDDVYRPFGGEGDVESVVFERGYYGGSGLRIVNETLGSTRFSGYAPAGSYYVRFEDGSILDPISGAPIVISGMNASFDGIVPNSFLGGILPSPVLSFIEDRLYDADDNTVNGRGQIFVGSAQLPGLDDIQDFFRNFRFGGGTSGGAILTINGLPFIGGGVGGLNNINPAAGEGGEEGSELAGISPAAGGDEGGAREVTCVADALSSIGSGSVTYKFGGTFEDSIASESKCASTNI